MKMNVTFKENAEVLGTPMSDVQQVTVIDSPAFTGTPTAPTPPVGDASERLATTEFVQRAIAIEHMGYGNIVLLSVAEVTS